MTMATQQISSENIAEIEKHKYFLSEKAGYDVGWDAAEQDWMSNYADRVNSSTPTISKAPGVGKLGSYLKRLLVKADKR